MQRRDERKSEKRKESDWRSRQPKVMEREEHICWRSRQPKVNCIQD